MPTKYANKAPSPQDRVRRPLVQRDPTLRMSYRTKLNLLMLASAVLVLFFHSLSQVPGPEVVTPLRGTAIIEAKASRVDADYDSVAGLWLRLEVPGSASKPVFAPVEEFFWDAYAVGDRVAVLYVPATVFSPARVLEVGVAALPAATPQTGTDSPEAESSEGDDESP
jgi:hypothetical protein